MSADGRLIIREKEDDNAKMEEEEGDKGGAACPFWERSCFWPGPGPQSAIHSLVHSVTICWGNR